MSLLSSFVIPAGCSKSGESSFRLRPGSTRRIPAKPREPELAKTRAADRFLIVIGNSGFRSITQRRSVGVIVVLSNPGLLAVRTSLEILIVPVHQNRIVSRSPLYRLLSEPLDLIKLLCRSAN